MTTRENQQYIFGSIFLLANKLQLLGDQVTKEITLKQWFLLNMIMQMNKSQPNYNDIAKAVGTTRQNVIKMLSVLHKNEMVHLHPSKTDNRAIYVTLTQKCLDYFSSKENAGDKLLDKLFIGLNKEEIEQTATVLGKVLLNSELGYNEE